MVRVKFPSKNGTGLYPGIRHKYMYIHFFPQFPMAFQETLCRGLQGVVLTKRMTDQRPTCTMYKKCVVKLL